MKVIEGIKKDHEEGWIRDIYLKKAEAYFQDETNIDNYNCFQFWEYNRRHTGRYLEFFYEIIKDWEDFSKSPYSDSMYSSKDIDWDYKPEGSYRLSNHWNFYSQGETHCKMEDETKNHNLLLCKYENGIYKIIKDLTEDYEKMLKLYTKEYPVTN